MRIVLQRVLEASVTVDGTTVGAIGRGYLALVGVGHADNEATAVAMAKKTGELRLFADAAGKMNLDVHQVGGSVLAVSQFTLLADCRKGRRPAFTDAALPEPARRIYEHYVRELEDRGLNVETGIFAADMKVQLINDGPVTVVLDRV